MPPRLQAERHQPMTRMFHNVREKVTGGAQGQSRTVYTRIFSLRR